MIVYGDTEQQKLQQFMNQTTPAHAAILLFNERFNSQARPACAVTMMIFGGHISDRCLCLSSYIIVDRNIYPY
jgi:hypothetical protein